MKTLSQNKFYTLDTSIPIWERIFTVAPLIVIGTKEGATYNLAPKHMATPIGFDNYFGFVCTPKHATYQNIKETQEFTVSFPIPDQVVLASLSAMPRCDEPNYIDPDPEFHDLYQNDGHAGMESNGQRATQRRDGMDGGGPVYENIAHSGGKQPARRHGYDGDAHGNDGGTGGHGYHDNGGVPYHHGNREAPHHYDNAALH